MSLSRAPAERARQEAADWFARLKRRDVPTSDLKAFYQWRKGPGNRDAYDEVDALWRRGATLEADPDIQNALREALERNPAPDDAPSSFTRCGPLKRSRLMPSLVIAVIAVLGAYGYLAWGPRNYSTDIGEQRLIRLADGSTIELDTRSKVSVLYSGTRRDIRLTQGQALFDVAHDAARPFVVSVNDASVTALGTRFDVRRQGEELQVTLLRGAVEVRQHSRAPGGVWRLAPGQAISTRPQAGPPKSVDVAAATSWTEGRLIFHAQPLSSAVAEVNRYNHEQIVLDVGTLANQPISGAFYARDGETFVASIAELHDLAVTRPQKGVIRLSQAGPDNARP